MLMSNQRGRGHEPVTVLGSIRSFVSSERDCIIPPVSREATYQHGATDYTVDVQKTRRKMGKIQQITKPVTLHTRASDRSMLT